MPIRYIGKPIDHTGKRLYEILYKLKNFGVGRMVHRNSFTERYPEPSYYVITRVEPDFADPILSVKSKAWAYQVWRGEDKGEVCITRCYKHDWRLVPKQEEESFINHPKKAPPANIINDKLNFAPLHEYLIMQDMKRQGKEVIEKPQLQRVIKKRHNNRALLKSEVEMLGSKDCFLLKTDPTGHL